MAAVPLIIPALTTDDGTPVSGALIHFKRKGTATNQVAYLDESLSTPCQNPEPCDAGGRQVVYLDGALSYDVTVKSADDATTYLPITYSANSNAVTLGAGWAAALSAALENGIVFDTLFLPTGNVSSRTIREWGARDVRPEDFGAVGNGIADDSAALQLAADAAIARKVKLIIPQKTYLMATAAATISLYGAVTVEGENPEKSKIVRNVDGTLPVLYANGTGGGVFGDGVIMRGVWTHCSFGGTATVGSLNGGFGGFEVERLVIEDCRASGNFYIGHAFRQCKITEGRRLSAYGVKNRGVYTSYDCEDIQLDDIYVDGEGVTDYGYNSNSLGTTTPQRLQIGKITVKGVTGHCVGLSGYYDHLQVGQIVTNVSGAAVGTLLQLANGERGRKFNIGAINHDGPGPALYATQSDDFTVGRIISENVDNVEGHVLIVDCKRWNLLGGNIIGGSDNGIYVVGNTASACMEGEISGFTVNGIGTGQGIYLIGAVANGVRRIGVHHNRVLGGAAYGIISSVNADRIDISHNIVLGNATAEISNSGSNPVTQDNIVT